jgi:hypothetical protein
VYQFIATLRGISPPIWRRIQVWDDYTLDQLHRALQVAMGWENYHEYEFLAVGEGIQVGAGQAYTYGKGQSLANSTTTETFLFAGVGASTPYAGANASAFYATPSSFGISLSGNLLAFQGGVGGYVNVSSLTSCLGF